MVHRVRSRGCIINKGRRLGIMAMTPTVRVQTAVALPFLGHWRVAVVLSFCSKCQNYRLGALLQGTKRGILVRMRRSWEERSYERDAFQLHVHSGYGEQDKTSLAMLARVGERAYNINLILQRRYER